MEIKIFSHADALEFVQQHPKEYDIIIISSRVDDYPFELHDLCKESLKLTFHDIDRVEEPYREPREEDIKQALEWARGRTKLISACQAGISRSSATAFLCKLQECGSVQEASKVWQVGRHWPNKLIVELGSKLLRKHPEALEEHTLFVAASNGRWYRQ